MLKYLGANVMTSGALSSHSGKIHRDGDKKKKKKKRKKERQLKMWRSTKNWKNYFKSIWCSM